MGADLKAVKREAVVPTGAKPDILIFNGVVQLVQAKNPQGPQPKQQKTQLRPRHAIQEQSPRVNQPQSLGSLMLGPDSLRKGLKFSGAASQICGGVQRGFSASPSC